MVAGIAELRRRLVGALPGALTVALLVAGCVPVDYGIPAPASRTSLPPTTTSSLPAVAVIRPVPDEPSPPPGSVEPLPSQPARPAPPVNSATQALLNQSRAHQVAGRYEQAAASIERALRIEPRQGSLWLELGNIRLKEGDFPQAESMGRKALSLSTGDSALKARAEQLIATAKRR